VGQAIPPAIPPADALSSALKPAGKPACNQDRLPHSAKPCVKYVVATGDVVEKHPDNQPDPKVLFMAHVQGEPLYVNCAFDGNCVYIVTVHRYDAAKWHDPWTRRKE